MQSGDGQGMAGDMASSTGFYSGEGVRTVQRMEYGAAVEVPRVDRRDCDSLSDYITEDGSRVAEEERDGRVEVRCVIVCVM